MSRAGHRLSASGLPRATGRRLCACRTAGVATVGAATTSCSVELGAAATGGALIATVRVRRRGLGSTVPAVPAMGIVREGSVAR